MVGSTCRVAVSGPRLNAWMRIRIWSGAALAILHEDIKVAVFGEHAGVEQLEFGVAAAAPPILLQQARVGKLGLRILVQALHVGVRGRVVEIEIIFLDVFPVVALFAGQPEETLFQNRVAAIPQRQGEADALVPVANAGQPVFVPPVGAQVRVFEREIAPSIAIGAVVLAHCGPCALRQKRTPAIPVGAAPAHFFHADLFGVGMVVGRHGLSHHRLVGAASRQAAGHAQSTISRWSTQSSWMAS